MEKIIDQLLQVKNEDEFWFRFLANQILEEFDFDYKQENEYLNGKLADLKQENDGLQEEVEKLEERNRSLIRRVDELQDEISELSEQLNEG